MEFRKVSSRNQVTLPQQLVQDFDLKKGDQVVFRKLDSSNYVISKVDKDRINSVLKIDPVEEYLMNPENKEGIIPHKKDE